MLTIQQAIDILRQQLPYLSAEYGITRLGIFGSYAKGTQEEQRDIDLVVEFKTPLGLRFVELTDDLEQLLNRPVDVLTPAGIGAIHNAQVARRFRRPSCMSSAKEEAFLKAIRSILTSIAAAQGAPKEQQ